MSNPSTTTKRTLVVKDADRSTGGVFAPGKTFFSQRYIRESIIGILVFLLAVLFNFYRLGVPSIWFDEAFSVELARLPLPQLWHIIFGLETNMELYYLLLHGWLRIMSVFGMQQTEFVVRFPSALFASCTAVLIYFIGRRYIGLIGGVLAAALYILNGLQLTYAQQTRAYALQSLLLCCSFSVLINAIITKKHKRFWWSLYIVCMVLSIYTHLFSFLLLFAQIVALAGLLILPNDWREGLRTQWRSLLVGFATLGLLVLPLLILSRSGSKTSWIPIPHLHDLYQLFNTICGGNKIYLCLIGACIATGIIIVTLSYLFHYRPGLKNRFIQERISTNSLFSQRHLFPLVWILLCWLLIPVLASYVISQGSTRLFSSRYLVVILPALFLLVAVGVSTLRKRVVQALLIIGLLVLTSGSVPQYYKSAQVEDWNTTSRWLATHYQANDGLVCYDNVQGCQIAMEYYFHAYPEHGAHFTADTPGAFSWDKYNFEDAGQALDTDRLAAYAKSHPHLFFIIARLSGDDSVKQVQATQEWLDTHYHFTDQFVMRTVKVRLYDTRTPEPAHPNG